MRHASGTKFGNPASFAADSASLRNAGGISGQELFVSGSIPLYRYPVLSVTQPSGPQFDMATDMRNPPGVIIFRKGERSTTSLSEESSSSSRSSANPARTAVPAPRASFGSAGSGSLSKSGVPMIPSILHHER